MSSKCAKGLQLNVRMFDGLQAYEPTWHAMQSFTDARHLQSDDELWVLQHPPVFTQGQAGKEEHVLTPGDIPVVKADRGGQVTYHGPGQLIIYLMIDIVRMGIGSRALVSSIEKAITQTLKRYGLNAKSRQDAPGVYVDECKIASIGLRIRNGKSFHGLSLNIDMDMEPFNRINPCGYPDLKMTQLASFKKSEAIEQVAGRLVGDIQTVFGYGDIMMEYCESV